MDLDLVDLNQLQLTRQAGQIKAILDETKSLLLNKRSAFSNIIFSLNSNVIDRALKIPDLASVASMHFLRSINIDAGPTTGLSFLAGFSIAAKEKKGQVLYLNTH
jgi:cysteine synthase